VVSLRSPFAEKLLVGLCIEGLKAITPHIQQVYVQILDGSRQGL